MRDDQHRPVLLMGQMRGDGPVEQFRHPASADLRSDDDHHRVTFLSHRSECSTRISDPGENLDAHRPRRSKTVNDPHVIVGKLLRVAVRRVRVDRFDDLRPVRTHPR